MYTEKHFYIPNQETFEKNQSGEYTTDQLAFFEQFKVFRFSIKQNSDTFLYNKKDKIFQFKQTKLNFLQSIEPFANRDGRMMPGITYEICYFEPEKSEAIFLSAKMLRPKSEDTISETMIYAMIPEIGFSKDDLLCNKSDMLSSSQVKNCRKKLKEYDPDPSIGTFNFVFAGSKTIETYNVNEEYFQRLQPFFTDEPNVFMFNVKYKIYFEEHQNSFLSIKPIEILDKQLYQPNTILISKDKQRIENEHRKELKTTTKKDTSSLRITLSFMIMGICFILFISKKITNSDVNIFLIISGIISTIIFLRENNMNQIQK